MKRLSALLALAIPLLGTPAWGQTKPPSPDEVVVARVDGKPITLAQFNRLVDRFPPEVRLQALLQKQAVLQNLVNRELLHRLALRENLEKGAEVQRRLDALKRDLLIEEAYRAHVVRPSEVGLPEARAHYEKNKDKYQSSAHVTASHIMVATEAEGNALLKELKAGKKFDALAREKSLAPERLQGGALGTFSRGQHRRTGLPKVVEDAAFGLKEGGVSGAIQSVYGWHVVKTFKHEGPRQRPFDDAREEIQRELGESKREKLLEDLFKRLRRAAKIELFPDRIP